VMPLDARPELSFSGLQRASGGDLNNGNGKVNPGENVRVGFELSRSGFGNLGLTHYTLTIPSMDVTLQQCSTEYGMDLEFVQTEGETCSFDLSFLGDSRQEFDLTIDVSQTVTAGTEFAVNLSAYDDIGNQWNDSISIPIKESDVEFVLNDYSIHENSSGSDDNGIPDAGETIRVEVSGENIGTDVALSLTGVCTTLDDYVTVSAGEVWLGSIDPGDSYNINCNQPHVLRRDRVPAGVRGLGRTDRGRRAIPHGHRNREHRKPHGRFRQCGLELHKPGAGHRV
jgi:hypothetical protein